VKARRPRRLVFVGRAHSRRSWSVLPRPTCLVGLGPLPLLGESSAGDGPVDYRPIAA